ncbi:MAG: PqqD family protein [Candidatus Promineifilaceae bacterium]
MALTQTSILQRSDSASYEVVAGEAILIDINTGTYFSLNKIGTEFWEMIDGTQSILAQATVVAGKYDVDVAMVSADLLEIAEKMAADGLVHVG